MCLISRLKTIKDIKSRFSNGDVGIPKECFKIIIIDDAFKTTKQLIEECKKNDYHIDYDDDFTNVEKYRNYDLILIDVRGVGGTFSNEGGLGVAKTLVEQLAKSKIVLFSAYGSNYIGANPNIDIINKPIKADKLCAEFDKIRKELADPIKGWEKIKTQCLKQNLPFKYIAVLEDKYVRSYNKGKPQIHEVGNNGPLMNKIEDLLIALAAQVLTNVLAAKIQ